MNTIKFILVNANRIHWPSFVKAIKGLPVKVIITPTVKDIKIVETNIKDKKK